MLCDQSAFYAQRISQGNTPIAVPMLETAGQSLSPQTVLNNQGYTVGMSGLSTRWQSGTDTNTTQASSLKPIYVRFFVVLLELGCKVLFLTIHRAK